MRVLVIKQNGPLVTVEASGGLRGSGATIQSALAKLGGLPEEYAGVARLFQRIPDDGRGGQIHKGVQS